MTVRRNPNRQDRSKPWCSRESLWDSSEPGYMSADPLSSSDNQELRTPGQRGRERLARERQIGAKSGLTGTEASIYVQQFLSSFLVWVWVSSSFYLQQFLAVSCLGVGVQQFPLCPAVSSHK